MNKFFSFEIISRAVSIYFHVSFKGSDIVGVFNRLVNAVTGIETFIEQDNGNKFMLDERLGYIHSCPTNLGTGMRASVHIKLPGWAKEGIDEIRNRCTELSLQCREISDEEGDSEEIAYDITNKNRLGYSEVEIIQCVIDGINTLYKEDLELQEKHE